MVSVLLQYHRSAKLVDVAAAGQLAVLLLLLVITLLLHLDASCAQAPGRFQSINCGGVDYTDNSTTLQWVKDDNYVSQGLKSNVEASLKNNTSVPLRTLRYFPISNNKSSKFCYNLSIESYNSYIVRVNFLYGNYDGLKRPPSFSLLLNYDMWVETVDTSSTETKTYEIIYYSHVNTLFLCLAPLPNWGSPFISTLEVRQLNNTTYNTGALPQSYGLILARRINYGANSSTEIIRYPDDEFDRIWEANTTEYRLSTKATNIITNGNSDPDLPPSKVMATAITSSPNSTTNQNLTFDFPELSGTAQGFRVDMHFAELLETPAAHAGGKIRILIENVIQTQAEKEIELPTFNAVDVSFDQNMTILPHLHFTIYTINSSLYRGPFLNALELMTWTPNALANTGTNAADYSAITNVRNELNLQSYGDGDPCLPTGYSWSWITCNNDTAPRIIALNLTNFNLSGDIPTSITSLSELEKIDLSNNMLTGTIPTLISSLSSLKLLNVVNNSLCGDITSLLSNTTIEILYGGNTNLCGNKKCKCPINTKKLNKYIIIILALVAFYIISAPMALFYYKRKMKKAKNKRFVARSYQTKKGDEEMKDILFTTRNFTHEEICEATNNFTTKIGEGGFGAVYKGFLNGQVVAVKMLSDVSKQGLKEFSTEVSILSRVRHKNLVSLLGFSIDKTYILIYEYVSKGNLRDLLHGESRFASNHLDWRTRLKIALDASKGLDYLHRGCDPVIIHRDVKSSNILLTDKLQARVCDFGLSRLKGQDILASHVSTMHVVGTIGYLDPEYNKTNQVTVKTDVYSFGVVLFELICARPAIDAFTSPPHIVDWVKTNVFKGGLESVVDSSLSGHYTQESMLKVLDIALGCVDVDKEQRPTMSEVAQVLMEAINVEMENVPGSIDVSSSSATSDGKTSNLRYIENLRTNIKPR